MRKLLWGILIALGCASGNKVEYSDWKTDRFLVTFIGEKAMVQMWDNNQFVRIERPADNLKVGQEITLTYRKRIEIICTDQNCRFEESYEVK
jgi:hypothetical protein